MSVMQVQHLPNADATVRSKQDLLESAAKHLYPGRISKFREGGIDFVPGERIGYRYRDVNGRELFDLHLNGGVFNLGHRNPDLIAVMQDAMAHWDIGNHHLVSAPKVALAEALINACPGDMRYVVLTASASEANDVAIKSARRATGRRKVVAIDAAYHGRTGLSGAAGDDEVAKYFGSDIPADFVKVPYNDLVAMERALLGNDVALVMMETIPATCGFPMPAAGYMQGVKALCERHGTMFLADEVQTGLGRSGKAWAIEHFDVEPDMLVTGKGLSGGLYPMSALVLTEACGRWLADYGWGHVSTFGGSDLGCHVALAALEMSTRQETLDNVNARASYLRQGLEALRARFPFFTAIRQLGLIFGLEFRDRNYGYGMMKAFYENGIWAFISGLDERVMQFKPGLLVDQAYCDELLVRVENALIWLTNNMGNLITGGDPRAEGHVMQGLESMAHQALKKWGIEGAELKLLKHRENTVFQVTTKGEQFALRVHRPGYHDDASLLSEIRWMQALNDAGIETPQAVVDQHGQYFVSVELAGDCRQCSMLNWVEGSSFNDLGRVARGVEAELCERYYKLGVLAAKVHNQSSKWTPPEGFKRQAWDEEGLLGEQPLWGRFWEHPLLTAEQKVLFKKARMVLLGLLKQIGKTKENYGLIHADFLPENILVHDGNLTLIDFDDCGYGWYAFEIAASLFPHADEPFFDALVAEYVRGYRTQRPLSDEMVELIPAFVMLRGFTYLGWLKTRPGSMPNASKIAPAIAAALSAFVPELLDHLTPVERLAVNALVGLQGLRDKFNSANKAE